LISSIIQKEHVSVMEGVSHLEGIDGISTLCFELISNLLRGKSIDVHIVVEFDFFDESGLGS
jgi:hypothetical protein